MIRLRFSKALGGEIPSSRQVRRPAPLVMRVGSENVDQTLIQKTFRPVLGLPSEGPSERACRHLHPDPAFKQPADHGVMLPDPGQALRMREDGDVASNKNIEEQIFQPSRRHMMGRLDEDITGVVEAQEMAGAQACDEFRHDVIVGPRYKTKRDFRGIKCGLQAIHRCADRWTGVVIKSRKDVRSTGDNLNPVGDERPRHRQ